MFRNCILKNWIDWGCIHQIFHNQIESNWISIKLKTKDPPLLIWSWMATKTNEEIKRPSLPVHRMEMRFSKIRLRIIHWPLNSHKVYEMLNQGGICNSAYFYQYTLIYFIVLGKLVGNLMIRIHLIIAPPPPKWPGWLTHSSAAKSIVYSDSLTPFLGFSIHSGSNSQE